MKGWTESDLPGKTKKPSSKPVTERSPPETTGSMDEQRSAFVADLVEQLKGIGTPERVSDNEVEFTRGKHTYQITIKKK